MTRGKNKGNSFEREICKELSLWWSNGLGLPENDNIFWRTSNSGGRATVRGKKGDKHCGDICAIDPIGQPLIDCVTIEVKRGYNSCSIQDLFDKPKNGAKQQYEKWFEQAMAAAELAGTPYWWLIVKRDRREPLVIMEYQFIHIFDIYAVPYDIVFSWEVEMYACQLQDFLQVCTDSNVQQCIQYQPLKNDQGL